MARDISGADKPLGLPRMNTLLIAKDDFQALPSWGVPGVAGL